MYNWDTPKKLLDFGDLDLIFKVTAVVHVSSTAIVILSYQFASYSIPNHCDHRSMVLCH